MSKEQQTSEEMQKKDTPVCGGWTEMQSVKGLEAAELKKLQGLLDQVREPAQVKGGRTFGALEPLEYATQVVAGVNYRIKAHTGDGINAVFCIYQPISGETVTLSDYAVEATQTAAK